MVLFCFVHLLLKKNCSLANWTSVFFPSSIQPSIHACSSIPLLTRLPSTTLFCSFLLVIHLWQPTPPSHILSLSICCSPSQPRHTPPLAHFVCLPVSVCSSYTHSHSPASSLTPFHLRSPEQHLFCLPTSWVGGIKFLCCSYEYIIS